MWVVGHEKGRPQYHNFSLSLIYRMKALHALEVSAACYHKFVKWLVAADKHKIQFCRWIKIG